MPLPVPRNLFGNLETLFQKTINGQYGIIDRELANRNPTGRGLQIVGKPFHFGAINSGNQPYIWHSPDDPNRTRGRYDSRRFPFIAGQRDALRITAFATSAQGLSFIANQANIQASNAFTETRIYNPLHLLDVAARSASGNILARPTRHFPPTSGVTGTIVSALGFGADGAPVPGTSAAGNSEALPQHYQDGVKGLQRLDTARAGKGNLETKWGQADKKGGGIFDQIKSKFKKAFPIVGLFTSAGGPSWEHRADEDTYKLMYEDFKKEATTSILRSKENDGSMNFAPPGIDTGEGKFRIQIASNKQFSSGQSSLISNDSFQVVDGNYLETLKQLDSIDQTSPLASAFDFWRDSQIKDESQVFLTGKSGLEYIMNFRAKGTAGTGQILVPFAPSGQDGKGNLLNAPSTSISFSTVEKDGAVTYIETLDKVGENKSIISDVIYEDAISRESDATGAGSALDNSNSVLSKAFEKLGVKVKDLQEGLGKYRTLEQLREVAKKTGTATGENDKYGLIEREGDNRKLEGVLGRGFPNFGSNNFKQRLDSVNVLGILDENDKTHKSHIKLLEKLDLIPFFFKDLVNQTRIFFRATLQGISESNSAEWSEIRYLGRADKIYNYTGFDRSLSFNFKVYVNSVYELLSMYEKVNSLVNFTKPGKNIFIGNKPLVADASIIVPPYCKLTIGDLYRDQPVIMNSISVSVPDESPWEILPAELNEGLFIGGYSKSATVRPGASNGYGFLNGLIKRGGATIAISGISFLVIMLLHYIF